METPQPTHRIYHLLIAALLPIATVLAFWTALPARFAVNDSADYFAYYEPMAHQLLEGAHLRDLGPNALAVPPGYTTCLAVAFFVAQSLNIPEPLALNLFTLFCLCAASALLYLTACDLWGPASSLTASAFFSAHPFVLWLTKQPNSEIPFIVALALTLFLFTRTLRQTQPSATLATLVGASVGIGMLIRPIAIFLSLPLCLGLILLGAGPPRSRARAACFILLGNLLVVGPWEAWVYSRVGQIVPLGTVGTRSMCDGMTFLVTRTPARRYYPAPPEVETLMTELRAGPLCDGTANGALEVLPILGNLALRHPVGAAKMLILKLTRSWYATDSRKFDTQSLWIQAVLLPLLLGSGWSAYRFGGLPRAAALSLAIIILYFWAMTSVVMPIVRYLTPALALGAILVPGFVKDTMARVSERIRI